MSGGYDPKTKWRIVMEASSEQARAEPIAERHALKLALDHVQAHISRRMRASAPIGDVVKEIREAGGLDTRQALLIVRALCSNYPGATSQSTGDPS